MSKAYRYNGDSSINILKKFVGFFDFPRDITASLIRTIQDPLLIDRIANFIESSNHVTSYKAGEKEAKLKEYKNSYDLSKYEKYAEQTSQKIKGLHTIFKYQDGNKSLNILEFGRLGEELKKQSSNSDAVKALNDLNNSISRTIKDTDDLLKKSEEDFLALKDKIGIDHNCQQPEQIIKEFNALKHDTLSKLKETEEKNCYSIRLFFDSEQNKKDLAKALNLDYDDTTTKDKIKQHINELIAHIQSASKEIEAFYNDTPPSKDGDKEIAGAIGMDKKLALAKKSAEIDLLIRIEICEALKKRGLYNKKTIEEKPLMATIGDTVKKKEDRTADLKSVTFKSLMERFPGNEQNSYLMRSGGTIDITGFTEIEAGRAKIKVRPQWFKSNKRWAKTLRADYEDMIDLIKANSKNQDDNLIHFTHEHKNESNKKMMIEESYRAARLKGYEPHEITMTVTMPKNNGNNKEEKSFNRDNKIEEVLKAFGLGNLEQEIQGFKSSKNPTQQEFITNGLKNGLKEVKQNTKTPKDGEDVIDEFSINPRL